MKNDVINVIVMCFMYANAFLRFLFAVKWLRIILAVVCHNLNTKRISDACSCV